MKPINILSLIQAHQSLKQDVYDDFLKHHNIKIKNDEILDLRCLISSLYPMGGDRIFDRFYVGYKIPQIGKEFDLLKIGKNYIINIEIKCSSTEEKIKNQLLRNKYYLNCIGKPVFNASFISENNTIYYLNDMGSIRVVTPSYLKDALERQEPDYIDDIDILFDPSRYLVSPFNSTNEFITGKYFLTHQQEEIKEKVIASAYNNLKPIFTSITGSAGTGKTLLVYDIVRETRFLNKKVIIIHCGQLNIGQMMLSNQHGWEIIAIKNYKNYDLALYDIIIVDEAQRIHQDQLENIVNTVNSANSHCIFSYDKVQTLASWEENRKIDEQIHSINSINQYKLTTKIRTNKEIANFIKALFDRRSPSLVNNKTKNIELNYFNNLDDAKRFIFTIEKLGWKVLRFTPSQYNKEYHALYSSTLSQTSHEVIGQEFDNVAVILDQCFSYASSGELIYLGHAYYHPVKMLFQNVTRTRKKLNIIIINNSEMLNRCISIT